MSDIRLVIHCTSDEFEYFCDVITVLLLDLFQRNPTESTDIIMIFKVIIERLNEKYNE
jgi:hypothetical protein